MPRCSDDTRGNDGSNEGGVIIVGRHMIISNLWYTGVFENNHERPGVQCPMDCRVDLRLEDGPPDYQTDSHPTLVSIRPTQSEARP